MSLPELLRKASSPQLFPSAEEQSEQPLSYAARRRSVLDRLDAIPPTKTAAAATTTGRARSSSLPTPPSAAALAGQPVPGRRRASSGSFGKRSAAAAANTDRLLAARAAAVRDTRALGAGGMTTFAQPAMGARASPPPPAPVHKGLCHKLVTDVDACIECDPAGVDSACAVPAAGSPTLDPAQQRARALTPTSSTSTHMHSGVWKPASRLIQRRSAFRVRAHSIAYAWPTAAARCASPTPPSPGPFADERRRFSDGACSGDRELDRERLLGHAAPSISSPLRAACESAGMFSPVPLDAAPPRPDDDKRVKRVSFSAVDEASDGSYQPPSRVAGDPRQDRPLRRRRAISLPVKLKCTVAHLSIELDAIPESQA